MFKKKKEPEQDRLGRRRQPSAEQRNATVFSYYANRSARPGTTGRIDPQAAPSAASLRMSRPRLLRRTPVIAGMGVLVVLVLWNSVLTGTARMVLDGPAAATGVPLRSQQEYADAANALLAESAFNKNKLTINTQKIADGMQARFPELRGAHVSVPFIGNHAVVHITPVTPQLLLNVGSALYVVDGNGRALVESNQVPGIEKLDLPVVLDQSGLAVAAGKQALSRSYVAFITEVIGQLEAKGLSITSVTLPAGTSEMDVKLAGAGYTGKFNLQGNGRVEAGAFLAGKDQLDREHKVPGSYIDVRVEDRAYYK